MTNDLMDHKAELSEAALAFVGNDQGLAVQKCFDSVVKSVSEIFDFLARGDNSLRAEIIRVSDEYRQFAQMIKEQMENNVNQ